MRLSVYIGRRRCEYSIKVPGVFDAMNQSVLAGPFQRQVAVFIPESCTNDLFIDNVFCQLLGPILVAFDNPLGCARRNARLVSIVRSHSTSPRTSAVIP